MSGEVKEVEQWVDQADKSGIGEGLGQTAQDNAQGKSGEQEDDSEDWMFRTFSRIG